MASSRCWGIALEASVSGGFWAAAGGGYRSRWLAHEGPSGLGAAWGTDRGGGFWDGVAFPVGDLDGTGSLSLTSPSSLSVSIASVIGWWFGCTVAALMNCIPFNWDWNDPDQRRHCFNYNIFWMASGACEILLDRLILTLPIGVIMRMRLSTQRKITISMIFLLGGLYATCYFTCFTGFTLTYFLVLL